MTLCPGSCERVFEAIDKPIPGKVECELCNLKFWYENFLIIFEKKNKKFFFFILVFNVH